METIAPFIEVIDEINAARVADADTLLDGWEVFWGLDPLDNTGDHGAAGDPDGDTVDNATEQRQGRNPTKGALPDTTGVTGLQVFSPLE